MFPALEKYVLLSSISWSFLSLANKTPNFISAVIFCVGKVMLFVRARLILLGGKANHYATVDAIQHSVLGEVATLATRRQTNGLGF